MLFQYGQMLVKRLHIMRDVNNDAHFCMYMLIIQVIITMALVGLRWGWGCSLQNNKTTRSIRLRQMQKKKRGKPEIFHRKDPLCLKGPLLLVLIMWDLISPEYIAMHDISVSTRPH